MFLLGFIYLFLLGIPLGIVFYLYSKFTKLGVSFFNAMGFSYIIVIIIFPALYLFAQIFSNLYFNSPLILFFPLFAVIFTVFFLYKVFKIKLSQVVILLVLEAITVILYLYFAIYTSSLVLKTFHGVPRYFCMYGEVDSRGVCNQDGLAAAGDGVFERVNIFHPQHIDFSLTQGKLLLVKNPFTGNLEVVKFESKEPYGDKLNVISVDSLGRTSTVQIYRQDIKGVDY